MIPNQEPQEIVVYRRRITGISWILVGVLGAIFALAGMWNWTVGLVLGLSIGMINFLLLSRQIARLASASVEKAKSGMILGHWMRYLLIGVVIYLVYRKSSVSFPAFLIGLALVYGVIFLDGWLGFKTRKAL